MDFEEKYIERFQKVIDLVGGNKKAALIIGKSEKSIERYKAGAANDASFEDICALTNAAGVSLEWIATGKGQRDGMLSADGFRGIEVPEGMELHLASSQHHGQMKAGLGHVALIPVIDIRASAGGGSVVFSEGREGFISFSRSWIEKEGLIASKLFTLPTVGDSMEPLIKPGDFILCSGAEDHVKFGDGIYVIRYDDTVLVKRLQCLPGKVKVSSDNHSYQPYEILLNDGTDFRILGKVVLVYALKRV